MLCKLDLLSKLAFDKATGKIPQQLKIALKGELTLNSNNLDSSREWERQVSRKLNRKEKFPS